MHFNFVGGNPSLNKRKVPVVVRRFLISASGHLNYGNSGAWWKILILKNPKNRVLQHIEDSMR